MFHLHTSRVAKYVFDSFVIFSLTVGSLHDVSSKIVHAANNDQQNAVACSIASPHEDLHEVTCVDSELAECRSM